MKILKHVLALLLVLTLPNIVVGQVGKVVGVTTNNNAADPPTGCTPSSTFNLVAASPSTINTFGSGATGGHRLEAGGEYNNYTGVVYQILPNTIAATIDAALISLYPSMRYVGDLQISSGNPPYNSNTYGTIYNPNNSKLLIHLMQTSAPCNVTSCLHLITLVPGASAPTIDQDLTFSSLAVSQSTLGGIADSSNYYFLHNNSGGTSINLYKFTTSLSFVNLVDVGAAGGTTKITDDGTNLWFTKAPSTLTRVEKSTLTVTNFSISGVTSFTGSIDYDATNNVVYAPDQAASLNLQRISLSSLTVTGTIGFGTDSPSQTGLHVDTAAGKVYFLAENAGTRRLRRISTTTFGVEQTYDIASGNSTYMGSPDFRHKRYFISDMTAGAGHVYPVTLCS